MATFSAARFSLTSNQTALAINVPTHLQPEINSLRRLHDKAFKKWDPHINILYPFVEPAALSSAVATLRDCLQNLDSTNLSVSIDSVGVFRHRKNTTVFLKPSAQSEESICQLRNVMVHALGCKEQDGTHDGVFRPHLTVGQAGFKGSAIEKLTEQVEKLAGLHWDGTTLVVLKREASGEMKVVGEIPLNGDAEGNQKKSIADDAWRPCYSLTLEGEWTQDPKATNIPISSQTSPVDVAIITYNMMAESSAPSFESRLGFIISALSTTISPLSSSLKVLCLQEINNEMLPLILSSPFIQTNFPFSTHMPGSLLPSHRNLVTLASAPFTHFLLPFPERHKTALIVAPECQQLEVANVHLTSALSNDAVEVKRAQMEMLTRFLSLERTIEKEIFVAGDFNLTTSSHTIETALSRDIITPETVQKIRRVINSEIWDDAFNHFTSSHIDGARELCDGEEGATFDRLTNLLAAMSESPIDNRPQRYDRVIFKKGGHCFVQSFENFGYPTKDGRCGSDHYGICATFRIRVSENTCLGSRGPDLDIPSLHLNDIEVVEDSIDLNNMIEPFLPSATDRDQRRDSITLLRQTLTSDKSNSDVIFAPLGSYCMDTYFADSDVDILAIGSVAPPVFFELATRRLRDLDKGFKGVHFVNSLVSIVEVCVLGIKFDLQYCQAPELLEQYHAKVSSSSLETLVFDPRFMSSLSPSSIRPLNTYRDTAYILNSIPDLPSFRTAQRYLSLYLKRRGLYSAKFGYLGGIHLSLMLNRVVKLVAANADSSQKVSHATIIRTFFAYYASFNWARDNITDPSLVSHKNVSRSPRDSIFIYSIHTPTARPNVASSCTSLTARTLTREFSIASEKLQYGEWQWCLLPKERGISDFLNCFGAFVRVDVDVWDVDDTNGDKVREMIGGLESKFPRLMVILGRIDGLEGRVWPARFRTQSISRGMEEQYKGYYLMGLSSYQDGMDAQNKRLFSGKVITAVREFEGNLKESKELQGGNIWVSMEVVPRRKVLDMNLVLDERDWGRSGEGREVLESVPKVVDQDEVHISAAQTPVRRKSPSNSLRPAQDIISRIHWDPALSVDDFVIGYEDRFVGAKEIPLAKWKSEQTDEEFIPRHRIVWVRRTGGKEEKVWDRRQKVDLIFGSGVSS